MATNGKRKAVSPPWYEDGQPDRWISVGRFAMLMKRSTSTIYLWMVNGTLKEFGYARYRDRTGKYLIQITDADLTALRKIEQRLKGAQSSQSPQSA